MVWKQEIHSNPHLKCLNELCAKFSLLDWNKYRNNGIHSVLSWNVLEVGLMSNNGNIWWRNYILCRWCPFIRQPKKKKKKETMDAPCSLTGFNRCRNSGSPSCLSLPGATTLTQCMWMWGCCLRNSPFTTWRQTECSNHWDLFHQSNLSNNNNNKKRLVRQRTNLKWVFEGRPAITGQIVLWGY